MAITNGLDEALDPCERCLLCFPLLLSENKDLTATGLEYVRRVERGTRGVVPAYRPWLEACVGLGEQMLDCIGHFGRLPLLNDSKARASTPEEIQWLVSQRPSQKGAH